MNTILPTGGLFFTPRPPHLPIGRLDVAGKTRGVYPEPNAEFVRHMEDVLGVYTMTRFGR